MPFDCYIYNSWPHPYPYPNIRPESNLGLIIVLFSPNFILQSEQSFRLLVNWNFVKVNKPP